MKKVKSLKGWIVFFHLHFFSRCRSLKIFLEIFIIHVVSSVILECDFQIKKSHWTIEYACIATNFKTSLSDRKISEVKGTHLAGKTNADVQKLYVEKQNCPYLPLDVSKFFVNLETFYFMKSNVQHLFNGDIDGLNKLKVFDVSHNPIEVLGPNFFDGHETIEIVSFFDCNLKSVHPNALKPLKNLIRTSFQYNVCIDVRFPENVQTNLKDIHDNCWSKGNKTNNKSFDESVFCAKQTSFASQNAVIILSFLSIILIMTLIVLTIMFTRRLDGDWSVLKKTLFWKDLNKSSWYAECWVLLLKTFKTDLQTETF